MSFTITLTGNESVIESQFFPAIDLQERDYELALLLFETFNAIPNVDESNNRFTFSETSGGTPYTLYLPTGAYEINEIENCINSEIDVKVKEMMPNFKKMDQQLEANPKEALYENIARKEAVKSKYLTLQPNHITLKCKMFCQLYVHFNESKSIRKLLGFDRQLYNKNVWYEAQSPTDISKVNIIRITCSLTQGAYSQGQNSHIIHEFSSSNNPGYKISEAPNNLIYFPVVVRSISDIAVKICDQDDGLVNFRGERITVRLHLRPRNVNI